MQNESSSVVLDFKLLISRLVKLFYNPFPLSAFVFDRGRILKCHLYSHAMPNVIVMQWALTFLHPLRIIYWRIWHYLIIWLFDYWIIWLFDYYYLYYLIIWLLLYYAIKPSEHFHEICMFYLLYSYVQPWGGIHQYPTDNFNICKLFMGFGLNVFFTSLLPGKWASQWSIDLLVGLPGS